MSDSQTAIDEHLTSDGVLRNYDILPKQYNVNLGSSSKKYVYFDTGTMSTADNDSLSFIDGGSPSKPFIISIWIRISSRYRGLGELVYFVKKGNWGGGDTTREYACGLTADNKPFFYLADESTNGIRRSNASTSTFTFDKWNHYIFSNTGAGDTANLTIALNGETIGTSVSDSGTYTAMENLGGGLVIGSSNLKADIARVAILPVNIDSVANARTLLYNSGCPTDLPGPFSSLTGWWRMGDHPDDAIDNGGGDATTNRIIDNGSSGLYATPSADDDWAISNFFPQTDEACAAFVPFSLGVRGVPFIRERFDAYKTNLD